MTQPASSYNDDLRLAHVLADSVDDQTMSRFKALDLQIETKPDLTPVTDADKAAEESIRGQLSRSRPRDAVLGEEFGSSGHGSRRWIIDPIDGTKNFVRGVPVWATLIALVDEGEPVVGVVSAPALGKRWWAAKGAGAYMGRSLAAATRLKVSNVSEALGRLAVLLQPRRLEGARKPGRVPRPHRGSLAHPRLRGFLVLLHGGRGLPWTSPANRN